MEVGESCLGEMIESTSTKRKTNQRKHQKHCGCFSDELMLMIAGSVKEESSAFPYFFVA
jgi:hypothetical protein